MSIKIGNNEINDVKLGNTQVNSIYLGSTKVWEKDPMADYIDTSTLTLNGIKNDPTAATGVAGTGWGDINKDTVKIRLYCNTDDTTINNLNLLTKTSSGSAHPDIGIFYAKGSGTSLNMNSTSTAVPVWVGTNGFSIDDWQSTPYDDPYYSDGYNKYKDFTVSNSSSGTYPNRYLVIGSLSAAYENGTNISILYEMTKNSDGKGLNIRLYSYDYNYKYQIKMRALIFEEAS